MIKEYDRVGSIFHVVCFFFLFQAEDGIRDLVRSRGLGDVYKRQKKYHVFEEHQVGDLINLLRSADLIVGFNHIRFDYEVLRGYNSCLLYTSDAADERSSVDLGGRRIITKKTKKKIKKQKKLELRT